MSGTAAVQKKRISLLGQPNSGKSTLFNNLTGARQHVGNWPGKTVEKKEGYFTYNGLSYVVADLPGTYSLTANSTEEIITRDYIATDNADLVCILADASQLERSLYMLADYAGINKPALLILNMMDIAAAQGKTIEAKRLEDSLGIPVLPFTAADKKAYETFYQALEKAVKNPQFINCEKLYGMYSSNSDGVYDEFVSLLPDEGIGAYSKEWLAAKLYEQDTEVIKKVKAWVSKDILPQIDELVTAAKDGCLKTGCAKFQWIDSILENCVSQEKEKEHRILKGFDRAATSKRWGKMIAVLVILIGLVCSYIFAIPGVLIVRTIFLSIINPAIMTGLNSIGAPNLLVSLLCGAVMNAITFAFSMTWFVAAVSFVFCFIEEIGYMARISFVFDNTMSKLGLQGKAIMPFLLCFGCTMGGAAGSRVIDSLGQRILTLALAWAVPCSATWGVVGLITGTFFGARAPLVIIALFMTMLLHMLITSKIFGRSLVKPEDKTGMIMELPPYHKPKWRNVFRFVKNRMGDILVRALKTIIFVSAIVWVLSYSPNGDITKSIIYPIGSFIEPVTRHFGLPWQSFVALISSMIGKEAALGVLSTLFVNGSDIFTSAVGLGTVSSGLSSAMAAALTQPEALAFLFAFTFNVPCIMALGSTYAETHSVKWTARIAGYYFLSALVYAFIAYHIGSLIM